MGSVCRIAASSWRLQHQPLVSCEKDLAQTHASTHTYRLFCLPFTHTTSHTHAESLTPLYRWHLTVGTTSLSATRPPGNGSGPLSLVAPSSELRCGPAQSLNYGQAIEAHCSAETFQFVGLYRKRTGTNDPSVSWKSAIQVSFFTLQNPKGFEACWNTHTSYVVFVPGPTKLVIIYCLSSMRSLMGLLHLHVLNIQTEH